MRIVGYSDRWSVQPGQTIRFYVHCETGKYRADLVRLIHGDENPKGPGFKEEHIASELSGEYDGKPQPILKGSYGVVEAGADFPALSDFTVQAWVWPTTPARGMAGIVTRWSQASTAGFGLFLNERGEPELWLGTAGGGTAKLSTGQPLAEREWYLIGASFEAASAVASVYQARNRFSPLEEMERGVSQTIPEGAADAPGTALLFGAGWLEDTEGRAHGTHLFNGKIAAPRLLSRALGESLEGSGDFDASADDVIGCWDFSKEIPTSRIVDESPNQRHGRTVNKPARAMTGPNWTGNARGFVEAPAEYDAIHFHDDDVSDAGWEESLVFSVPSDLKSGVYAARLRAEGEVAEDHLPFFVRPATGKPTAAIAFLAPTLTYQAYANESLEVTGYLPLAPLQDMNLQAERFAYTEPRGLKSTYDLHSDGSGVCTSSILHPILDFRPKALCRTFSAPHNFAADLHLVDWLTAKALSHDVITDHDLHRDGVALLNSYNVVVTGAHPEYWTRQMLEALEAYLDQGGRMMYLGGNGFYWVTAIDPEDETLMEIRRWGGTRQWHAEPGEETISLTGEIGGIWRDRGRAPQKMLGVGFTAMGFDRGSPYVRKPDSYDPRAAFIFEGIDSEVIGDIPALVLNHGAAGFEVDKANPALGTPAHTLVLASTEYHTDAYHLCVEEIHAATRNLGSVSDRVGADMVFLEYPNGGAVFSVGSITWSSTLSYDNYGGDTSRITENVVRAFAKDTLP